MTIFDKLERRIGWISFPGFLRFYALFHVLVFVLRFIRPDIGLLLDFDKTKILSGEVWRMATFFFAGGQIGRPSMMSIIFLACAVNFIFMVSDGLEGAWGIFKTTLFYYTGIFLLLVANFVYPMSIPASGFALYASAFFAFATLFPKVEILLFMILPVQIRILAIIQAVGLGLMLLGEPLLFPFMALGFANFIFWAAIPALRGTARIINSGKRKRAFNSAKIPPSEAFHTCATCERTDVSHPGLEFRVGNDGHEYCDDHLRD